MFFKKRKLTYTDENGYKRFSDSDKSVHRHVAERKLGRPLRSGEVVHHINRDKQDNRRDNLWVFPDQDKHEKAHRKDKRKYGSW